MSMELLQMVELFARRRGFELPPDWAGTAGEGEDEQGGPDALLRLSDHAGWKAPAQVPGRPRANQFPLLVYKPNLGWAVAEQWDSLEAIRVTTPAGPAIWPFDGATRLFEPSLPRMADRRSMPRAIDVFWRSLLLRKRVFLMAVLATVIVNVITLATSLYSMQVYDRVIPRSGFSTLIVLTVGVLFALVLDFALRTTRALMIEREAARIDAEVSEFFFARAQSIRLDARPPGVGTMAAQLRGLEQVRSLLSSGSVFLVADLPFALFFILIIFALGGIIALVPLVSLPIALGLGYLFARLIRSDTARAQTSGNRKNGLLVEAIDAAETIKSHRGGWHMLARWNSLMDEVQLAEDPVKRWSSVAASIFATLQQISYVGLIAWGAVQVASGEMTIGALIACAIIAGRVNGPLVAQLPSFLVQWGYARSSLNMLDQIMALPLDQPEEAESLRPDTLDGPIRLTAVQFAYPGGRSGVEVPAIEISPGERVAVIGGVGSGKSTLLRLMAGLYAPAAGSITIAGLEMGQVAPDVLRRHIGYLPQDTRLLNGTLRQNLLLGLSDPGDAAVLDAADRGGLKPMIANHPLGLDLPITEGGRGLSGGQRTLAGLTRLMLADPKAWLLDEPTANLDQTTEARVLAALKQRLEGGSTLVLVTHRLRLLSLVDRVIVMAGGRVRMDGPTAEIVAKLRPTKPIRAVPAAEPAAGGAGA